MKKKWLVLGLAAIMSFGCLAACGDNDDKGGDNGDGVGSEVIKGEQVTAEQWASACDNIDFRYVVEEWWEKELSLDGEVEEYWEKYIYYENYNYGYEKELEVDGEGFYEDWKVEQGNKTYRYEKWTENYENTGEDSGVRPWRVVHEDTEFVGDVYLYYDSEDFQEDWVEYDITEFTFDEEKGVYYKTSDEEERIEMLFLGGKLYSITVFYTDADEDCSYEGYWVTTFKKEEIPALPDKAALDALIAQNG